MIKGQPMKGYVTGIAVGLVMLLIVESHPIWAVLIGVLLSVVIVALWTKAVEVRFERN